ncbi:hypothetical protein [Pseudomonas chlororaphis]|uniref:hypothetical protein n=1 Tax=Pseudomonas chlororaphis TaxID=587753 RepID=UPI0003D3691A|nr:hypothetical protein [Pseudomonas chlororaphis]AZD30505.1 hypothetical protein C4K23_3760 [Pseudomonas chlororaphis]ETD40669.1 hypothetical protein U724_01310 [Pseudomonas chlororaphis subsp. aurantiaca PB-St2]
MLVFLCGFLFFCMQFDGLTLCSLFEIVKKMHAKLKDEKIQVIHILIWLLILLGFNQFLGVAINIMHAKNQNPR